MYSSLRSCSVPSFYLSFAFVLSRFERIELSVPVANENEMTPATMSAMPMIYSVIVPPEISPKPTVVMVAIVKYSDTT